ncbi:MAG: TIGR02217 family protein [Alphaproteobacteria bacterium]|nr:MAG: TIGR02217 family protein [Alphaproteobacteria bacterium]
MSFHEIRFPTRISYGASGGPRFSTTVQILNSGFEQRNINWAEARREYSFDISPSRGEDWAAVLAFFHARYGRAYGFRLKDFSDFEMAQQQIGTGDGATTEFQIFKRYVDVGEIAPAYDRPLKKIVADTALVWVDGTSLLSGWSVDETTGLLTFDTAPESDVEISVSCEFDVPVRFDTDLMQAAIPGPDIHHWQSIKLVEVRL